MLLTARLEILYQGVTVLIWFALVPLYSNPIKFTKFFPNTKIQTNPTARFCESLSPLNLCVQIGFGSAGLGN